MHRGKFVTLLVCEECGNVREREELFSDLPLQVKGVKSVEESLSLFSTVERLDGDNKYFCQQCNKKVNATKCTKIRQFPPILTLALNRFEIDFTTMDRKKVIFLIFIEE